MQTSAQRIWRIRAVDGDACVLALAGCEQVAEDLRTILRGWHVEETDALLEPALIRLKRTANGYLRISPWSRTPSKCRATFRTHHTDALFGVHYDLLSWYAAAQRDRPCLHGAAVSFRRGLVVFPNTTRAGKTTLTIQLAIAGQQVFCDDWLPIQASGKAIALGILPWLRLPVPRGVRDDFARFLKVRQGPRNRHWTYVNLLDHELAPHGATAAVDALVLLDRVANAPPRLGPIAKDRMLAELITQNYARQVPAADIFEALHALTHKAECYRLRYGCVREAAAHVQRAFT